MRLAFSACVVDKKVFSPCDHTATRERNFIFETEISEGLAGVLHRFPRAWPALEGRLHTVTVINLYPHAEHLLREMFHLDEYLLALVLDWRCGLNVSTSRGMGSGFCWQIWSTITWTSRLIIPWS